MSNLNTEKNIPLIKKGNIIEEYKIKSLYLAKCAHEIKNILISIISFIENSQITINSNNDFNDKEDNETNSNLTPEKSKNFLKSLCDFGMNIIFDINRLSKEEHINRLNFSNEKREEFNAIEALNFCAQMFESRCSFEKKNIKIEKSFQIPYHKKINSIGQIKFKQVIINLLSNSYKFTIKGYIKLSAEKFKNKIKITISDTGVGFNKSDLNDMNSPFQMIKNNQYLNKNGSGLGLYITNEILNFCGSELKYESQKGVGSKFWFELDDYNIIDPTFILSNDLKKLITEINSGNKDSFPFIESNNTYNLNINENSNKINEIIKNKNNPFNNKNYIVLKTMSRKKNKYNTSINFERNKKPLIIAVKKKNSSLLFNHRFTINKNYLNFKLQNNTRSYTIFHDFKNSKSEEIFNQKNLKILICDDDRLTALSTRNTLIKYFKSKSKIQTPEILLSQNGIECLYIVYKHFLKDKSINLIFIDKNMPFIDGTLTCSIIKNSVELNSVKIFMLSSGNVNVSECKADGFYSKPLTSKVIDKILINEKDFNKFL